MRKLIRIIFSPIVIPLILMSTLWLALPVGLFILLIVFSMWCTKNGEYIDAIELGWWLISSPFVACYKWICFFFKK
jgi:hypothetical protein